MPIPLDSDKKAKIRELARLAAECFNDEQPYIDLTWAAADICDADIALISIHDGDRMWFRTKVGLSATEIPKKASFCECAMGFSDKLLVVENAAEDPRFVSNPLVTGPLGIRFYVGAPLVISNGQVLGNLCVLDSKPKKLDADQMEMLQFLGKQVAEMLEKSKSYIPANHKIT